MKLSTNPKLVTIFGGSGFVGRHAVRALVNRGYRVRVAVRRPDLAKFLQPLGNVGQIQLVQANLRYPDSVNAAVHGADIVVNLVGILKESGKQKFDSVILEGSKTVAEAAKEKKAEFIHLSAILAESGNTSTYQACKSEAEEAISRIYRKAIILRPSVIFGPEDEFFNMFGAISRFAPFLPLIGGGKTRLQPVYVGDVAKAIAKATDGELSAGKAYELGGPQVMTMRECMELVCKEAARPKLLLSIPFFVASVIGKLTGWIPGAPLTGDMVEQLKNDNVVSEEAIKRKLTLEGMGITPTPADTILPSYMVQYRPHGQFTKMGGEEV